MSGSLNFFLVSFLIISTVPVLDVLMHSDKDSVLLRPLKKEGNVYCEHYAASSASSTVSEKSMSKLPFSKERRGGGKKGKKTIFAL